MRKRSGKKIWGIGLMILAMVLGNVVNTGENALAKSAGKAVKKLTLNVKSMTMQAGDSMKLKVTAVAPSSASKKVTWKSSDKKVVTVSKSGVIRAKKKGTATVTAKAKSGKASVKCNIKVNRKSRKKKKVLVAYFSATGNTKGVAKKIAEASGGDMYRITPAQKYTAKDLDYNNDASRTNREQNRKKARPAMKGTCAGIQDYQVIFVGFPIWWGQL